MARSVFVWVWWVPRPDSANAEPPRRRWASRGPRCAVGDPEPERPAGARSEPGKIRGAAAPSSGRPEHRPALRQPLAVGAAAGSKRSAETQGPQEDQPRSTWRLLEASDTRLAGTACAGEELGRLEGRRLPGLGMWVRAP